MKPTDLAGVPALRRTETIKRRRRSLGRRSASATADAHIAPLIVQRESAWLKRKDAPCRGTPARTRVVAESPVSEQHAQSDPRAQASTLYSGKSYPCPR